MELKPYQSAFIAFLLESEALLFGEFVTKSGRKTPYFVNTGKFNTGERIQRLGEFYAAHIIEQGLTGLEVVFGPAYKGIPLCVSTAAALFKSYKKSVGYCFDRKEQKLHGDTGKFVGYPLSPAVKVVVVEDVITAGTTLKEVVPLLRGVAELEILGVVIAVDRCERGSGKISAVKELADELGIKVYPVVTIHQIIQHLSREGECGYSLSPELKSSIEAYLREYGA